VGLLALLRGLAAHAVSMPGLGRAWIAAKKLEARIRGRRRGRLLQRRVVEKFFELRGATRYNVVIVCVDCMRYFNTSMAGYRRNTTPGLMSLGDHLPAVAASPHTYSSVPSILTGLYPHVHGAVIGGDVKNFDNVKLFRGLRRGIPTLFDVLAAVGYRVFFAAAIDLAYYPLRGRVPAVISYDNADKLLAAAARRIREGGGRTPIAMYIHLGDLHDPITPPKEYRSYFGEPRPDAGYWRYTRCEEQHGEGFEAYRESRILLYDNALRYVDDAITRFVSMIDSVLDDTILIVTADHGEEFWEHSELECRLFYDPRGVHGIGHGHNLFAEITLVPLVARLPSSRLTLVGEVASITDVTPTVLGEIGIKPRYDWYFDGVNLAGGRRRDVIISEAVGYGYEKKAVITGGYKLIVSKGDGVRLIYSVRDDPFEQHPLDDRERGEALEGVLKARLARGYVKVHAIRRVLRGG